MSKRILLEALITEREGMLAENTHRLSLGQSIAYGDKGFEALANRMRAIDQPTTEGRKLLSAVAHEAHVMGRIYAGLGEKEKPSEVYDLIELMIEDKLKQHGKE